jgi:hypothetical protein
MVVTRKSLIICCYIMDHQKAERVSYHDGIRYFPSFSQSDNQKLCSVQPQFCLETEISSEVDLQNSVSSKPLVCWGCISNQRKAGRVFQLFWYSTQGKNPTRTALEFGFLSALQSVQKCSFQQTCRRANSHGTWTVERLRFFNKPLETWECVLSLWYSALGWIPLIAMASLWFLTATHSQVRFDVSAKSLVKVFLVDSMIATNHVISVAWDGVLLSL